MTLANGFLQLTAFDLKSQAQVPWLLLLQATRRSSRSLQEPSGHHSPQPAVDVVRLKDGSPAPDENSEDLTGGFLPICCWFEGVSFYYTCPLKILTMANACKVLSEHLFRYPCWALVCVLPTLPKAQGTHTRTWVPEGWRQPLPFSWVGSPFCTFLVLFSQTSGGRGSPPKPPLPSKPIIVAIRSPLPLWARSSLKAETTSSHLHLPNLTLAIK